MELVSCHSNVRVEELGEILGINDVETHLEKMFYNNSLEDYKLVFDGSSQETWIMKGEDAALEEEKINRIIFSKDEMNRAATLEGYEPLEQEEEVDKANGDVCRKVYELGMDGITNQYEIGYRQFYNFAFECDFTPVSRSGSGSDFRRR
ncbi:unnamed protein product [Arabis nemorensis]|uniref:Uncharacterized protein n=1 Tax=Arabis nemorensis TaxID=586526 RepID=A0A565B4X9_9BRAS|nr:unnamed protein product [Arabis nemorensis]